METLIHTVNPPPPGGGTPLYKLYRYVPPQRVWFFAPFWSENGYRICPFWSGNGYGFRRNYGSVWTIYRFNFNWVNKKEKCANSKWISRNFFCCCSNLRKDLKSQVWKWVWKMTFFGLKQGQDLENRAAHPHQEFPGVPPRNQTSCKRRSSRPGVGDQLPEVGQISCTLRGKLKRWKFVV